MPPQSYLVALDIESLYTNIRHEEAVASFKKIFEGHPQYTFLLSLLRYVLENNVFQFNDELFSQLCGIAMGTKLAPALATIYTGDLEEEFIQGSMGGQTSPLGLIYRQYFYDLDPYKRKIKSLPL